MLTRDTHQCSTLVQWTTSETRVSIHKPITRAPEHRLHNLEHTDGMSSHTRFWVTVTDLSYDLSSTTTSSNDLVHVVLLLQYAMRKLSHPTTRSSSNITGLSTVPTTPTSSISLNRVSRAKFQSETCRTPLWRKSLTQNGYHGYTRPSKSLSPSKPSSFHSLSLSRNEMPPPFSTVTVRHLSSLLS